MAIVGDVAHSRVARSAIWALTRSAPRRPVRADRADARRRGRARWGDPAGERQRTASLDEALEGADAVMALRLQTRAHGGVGLLPSLGEFTRLYRLTRRAPGRREARRAGHAPGADEPRRRDRLARGRLAALGDPRAGHQRRGGALARAVLVRAGLRPGGGRARERCAAWLFVNARLADRRERRARRRDLLVADGASSRSAPAARAPGRRERAQLDAQGAVLAPGPGRPARAPARARAGAQGDASRPARARRSRAASPTWRACPTRRRPLDEPARVRWVLSAARARPGCAACTSIAAMHASARPASSLRRHGRRCVEAGRRRRSPTTAAR